MLVATTKCDLLPLSPCTYASSQADSRPVRTRFSLAVVISMQANECLRDESQTPAPSVQSESEIHRHPSLCPECSQHLCICARVRALEVDPRTLTAVPNDLVSRNEDDAFNVLTTHATQADEYCPHCACVTSHNIAFEHRECRCSKCRRSPMSKFEHTHHIRYHDRTPIIVATCSMCNIAHRV